jgi:hypothetical protein
MHMHMQTAFFFREPSKPGKMKKKNIIKNKENEGAGWIGREVPKEETNL